MCKCVCVKGFVCTKLDAGWPQSEEEEVRYINLKEKERQICLDRERNSKADKNQKGANQKTDVDTQTNFKNEFQDRTEILAHRCFYSQRFLHRNPFTHRPFYTKTLWHTGALLHRPYYAQMLVQRHTLKRRWFYIQTLLHRDLFTHEHSHTQAYLHTDAWPHRLCYTQTLHTQMFSIHTDWKLLYTDLFTHGHFYTRTLLHTDAFIQRLWHTDAQSGQKKKNRHKKTPPH